MKEEFRAVICMAPRGCDTCFHVPVNEIDPVCINCKQRYAIGISWKNVEQVARDPERAKQFLENTKIKIPQKRI